MMRKTVGEIAQYTDGQTNEERARKRETDIGVVSCTSGMPIEKIQI